MWPSFLSVPEEEKTTNNPAAAGQAFASAEGLNTPGLNPADLLALFGTGLSQRARLIELETAQGLALPDRLVVERFHGVEAVNPLLRFDIDCLSGATSLDLKQFIGEQPTLRVLLPGGDHRA